MKIKNETRSMRSGFIVCSTFVTRDVISSLVDPGMILNLTAPSEQAYIERNTEIYFMFRTFKHKDSKLKTI